MNKGVYVPADVIDVFDAIIDYAMTVKSVTGYKCSNEPDLLAACRIMEKLKKGSDGNYQHCG